MLYACSWESIIQYSIGQVQTIVQYHHVQHYIYDYWVKYLNLTNNLGRKSTMQSYARLIPLMQSISLLGTHPNQGSTGTAFQKRIIRISDTPRPTRSGDNGWLVQLCLSRHLDMIKVGDARAIHLLSTVTTLTHSFN